MGRFPCLRTCAIVRAMGNPARAVNIAELRHMARARLPAVVFDYLDGAAEDERTLRDNMRAFRRWLFRHSHGCEIPDLDLSVTVMGQRLEWPALTAPIGYSGLFHKDGEAGVGRAVLRAGIGSVPSTISRALLEYVWAGRAAGEDTLARAEAAGVKGLFRTIDTPVAGMRERDFRNGLAQLLGRSWTAKARYLPDILAHPGWLMGYLSGASMPALPNVVVPGQGPFPLIDVAKALERSVVTWDDLKWIRAQWKGPIAIKGVLTGDDTRRAIDGGADAVVVSNHGGRQLDGVAAGLDALPEVVEAASTQCEVLMDGGIR